MIAHFHPTLWLLYFSFRCQVMTAWTRCSGCWSTQRSLASTPRGSASAAPAQEATWQRFWRNGPSGPAYRYSACVELYCAVLCYRLCMLYSAMYSVCCTQCIVMRDVINHVMQ